MKLKSPRVQWVKVLCDIIFILYTHHLNGPGWADNLFIMMVYYFSTSYVHAIVWFSQMISKPSDTQTTIFQENLVNPMAAELVASHFV